MIISLIDAAKYFKELPHQVKAWEYLQQNVGDSTLTEFATLYRDEPSKETQYANTWKSIEGLARDAGAKFPELAAAQWALESAYGSHLSGQNNFFGIKGKGTVKQTWEDYGNGPVYINAEFQDFDTPYDCVNYLVSRWYKDYKGYAGVNRAETREEAARLLKAEGYATDPNYTSKLIKLMNRYA